MQNPSAPEPTPRAIYRHLDMDQLNFQFGVFEHEMFNRVIIRTRKMDQPQGVESIDLLPAEKSELWLLSQTLGIDPGMRKLALDSLPKNSLGIVFINRVEGIFCIFYLDTGSYSGREGSAQVREFYFRIPKTNEISGDFVEYYPLYNSDDLQGSLSFILESSREFYETFYTSVSEFYEKSDEKFEQLFNQVKNLLNKTIDMRQSIQDTLAEGNMRGIMYFERPTFNLQAIMEAVIRDMQPVETMRIPFQ